MAVLRGAGGGGGGGAVPPPPPPPANVDGHVVNLVGMAYTQSHLLPRVSIDCELDF